MEHKLVAAQSAAEERTQRVVHRVSESVIFWFRTQLLQCQKLTPIPPLETHRKHGEFSSMIGY